MLKAKIIIIIVLCSGMFCGCSSSRSSKNHEMIGMAENTHISETALTLKTESMQGDIEKEAKQYSDCSKAYSKLISSYNNIANVILLHINDDSTPEIIISDDEYNAELYSYDGEEVYSVSTIRLNGYASYGFHCRSGQNMISYESGVFAKGTGVIEVVTFYEEYGRLKKEKCVNMTARNQDITIASLPDVLTGKEECSIYDIFPDEQGYIMSYGTSWKSFPYDCINLKLGNTTISYLE